ncbi:hypothetical protein FN846DRAFT_933045 [Sphaerosporella brunnea]|uniref:HTH CENPB-type domain-containing protein n=1 Tax=Sphaerosporella brunnea TaxID=1250544 RepID=A0A5J5F6G1_9PEZI|nr:hypothetical protein FN846DRAFT_933045 [Sphaerosporella brunnea]
MHKFSVGWLAGWKEQYGVKEHKSHGEAGSAPISEAKQKMQQIHAILSPYDLQDIYNADETSFYRVQPDRSLETEQMAGKKMYIEGRE